MAACKNCGAELFDKHCHRCGQKATVKRIELLSLIKDLPHAIFHVDHGFFYNLKNLFTRPGFAIKDYLDGRRKPFFNPVTYLVILLVLNYIAVKVTNLHYYDEQELLSMSPKEIQFIKDYDKTQWWFLEHTYYYMLIAIPVSSVFYYFFFRLFRIKYNLAECAIILMFIIAQGVFMQSCIYFAVGWVRNGAFIRGIEIVNLAILILYASYAIYQLFNPAKRKLWRILASLIGGSITLLLMLLSAYWLLEIHNIFSPGFR
jgi:hypothetical protein